MINNKWMIKIRKPSLHGQIGDIPYIMENEKK